MRRHGGAVAITVVVVLYAGLFALRLSVDHPEHSLGLTYALPIALAAVFLGRAAGIAAAAAGVGLWIAQRGIQSAGIEPLLLCSHAVTYVLLGALLGHFVEREARAQYRLEEAEGGYRGLLERVPAIVYTAEYGPHGRWTYVSPKIEQILGYTVEEWIARPEAWYERLHLDDREQALAAEDRSSATGEALDSEYRLKAKDGRLIWFRDQATVVHDDDGQPKFLQGVMLDITSRKRAEDELELRYAVQKRLAEAASLNEGLHGVLKTVAARFGWQLGAFWTVDEQAEKLKLTDMWHSDDIDGAPFETASRGLRIAQGEGLPGRAWQRCEPIWEEDVCRAAGFLRKDTAAMVGVRSAVACPAVGGNQMRGVLEFFSVDGRPADDEVLSLLPSVGALVADFVATRATIEKHRVRFQAILDNAPAVVFAKDLNGHYMFVNRRMEEVIGLPAAEIEGRTNHELFPEDVAQPLAEHDRQVLSAGHQLEFEEVVPHEDGVHTYLTVKFPLRDLDGEVHGVCGISTDITELKRVQFELDERSELERANRAKSAFLSRVSHELRTPLNAILGFGQVLEVDALSERQRNSVQQIMKGGRHLLELVNDLLEISRIEAGEMSVSLGPVEISEAVTDIVHMVEPLAAERSVSISHHADPETPVALADEQRVKQVLLNLLSNAIKYNRDGGQVDVVVTALDGGGVAVRITDTGAGIGPDDLDRLFSPFERLGAEQSGIEGTGLGLALSKLMVEAMHGSLEVTSVRGKGSTFTVELPPALVLADDAQALVRAGR